MTMNVNFQPEKVLFHGACILFAACLVIFFTSCSMSRKVNKDIEKSRSETASNEKTATNTQTDSKTRTTIEGDSVLNFPGSKADGMKPLFDLQRGDTLKTENNDVSASVFIDKNGNVGVGVRAKPKDFNIKVNKTTETTVKEVTDEHKKINTVTKKEDIKELINTDTKVKNNLPWLFLLLIPIAILGYIFRKQIPYIKNL